MQSFVVTVMKKARRAPYVVELLLERVHPAEPMDHWPELVLRVLADVEGSPLSGAPLYDEGWVAEHMGDYIDDVTLVKLSATSATCQLEITDAELAALVKKGDTWASSHRPTSIPHVLGGAWSADGKAAVVAYSHGVARLMGITKKAVGRCKATMFHRDLCAALTTPEGIVTVGGAEARFWDPKGKKVLRTAPLPSPAVAACLFDDAVLVGLSDGTVAQVEGDTLEEAGEVAITALASGGGRVAAGFADGRVIVWSAGGAERLALDPGAEVTALGFDGDTLLVARADGAISVGDAHEAFPVHEKPRLYVSVPSPDHTELLFQDGNGHVCCSKLEGGEVTTLGTLPMVTALQYSPSGRFKVAHVDYPNRLYLWGPDGALVRMVSGPAIKDFSWNYQPTRAACFSPSERLMAVHVQDDKNSANAIMVFDTEGAGGLTLANTADYSWAESMVWLDEDRLLVSYVNDVDKIWTISDQSFVVPHGDSSGAQVFDVDRGILVCSPRCFEEGTLEISSREDLTTVVELPFEGLFGSSTPPTAEPSATGSDQPRAGAASGCAAPQPSRLRRTPSGSASASATISAARASALATA